MPEIEGQMAFDELPDYEAEVFGPNGLVVGGEVEDGVEKHR